MATLIPEETIKHIQRTADIVDVVSKRVLLKKAGKNFIGLCPFHTEKTPSFSVNPEKNIFYCFGCGTGGDVFSFLMKLDGLSFPDAARSLASSYGIDIIDQRLSPSAHRAISEKDKICKINSAAATYYSNCLCKENVGRRALVYLSERGITSEIIDKFKLGYAPPGWSNLAFFLKHKKVSPDLIQKAGLLVARKDGNGYYDRFRDRIIFPILDSSQRIIGFGGRVLDDGLPKYLNSPETPVYHKSRSLFGIHWARRSCRETGRVYLVEGYFDLIALHLFGIENCVATLGTSLTAEHVQILRGFVGKSGKVILVYDSDVAGIKAAERSIAVFESGFLEAQILILPSGYDPDTYIREHGKENFLRLSGKSLGIVPFLLESAIKRHGLSIDGKVRIIQELIEPLTALADTVARSLYVKNIGERLDIDEYAILEKIKQFSRHKSHPEKKLNNNVKPPDMPKNSIVDENAVKLNNRVRIEHKLVAMLLHCPGIIPEVIKRRTVGRIQDEALRGIGQLIVKTDPGTDDIVNAVLSRIQDEGIKRIVASLAILDEQWDLEGCYRLMAQYENSVKRGGDDLLQRIKAAERDNDIEVLQELLKEKQLRARAVRQHQ